LGRSGKIRQLIDVPDVLLGVGDPMKVAVLRETFPGEKRVALIPASVPQLAKAGMQVLVQSGAGEAAGYSDAAYQQRGAELIADRRAALNAADTAASPLFGG
jgi:H+-translocating NAD(P) transhydrogenase subunit alpha